MNKYKIDAANQSIGRLASKIAVVLRGKNDPNFKPNIEPETNVIVSNIKDLKWTGNKIHNKKYYRYSGYPGGIRSVPLKKRFSINPGELLRSTVYHMLPKNKMRNKIIKMLKIE